MKRVVLCGSLRHLPQMEGIRQNLLRAGFCALCPAADPPGTDPQQAKLQALLSYGDEIVDAQTLALLVCNLGPDHYIGPSTFAEVVIGLRAGRPIYLLQDTLFYREELHAWGVVSCGGSLPRFLAELRRAGGAS